MLLSKFRWICNSETVKLTKVQLLNLTFFGSEYCPGITVIFNIGYPSVPFI